jgi:hypothetical protein
MLKLSWIVNLKIDNAANTREILGNFDYKISQLRLGKLLPPTLARAWSEA